MLLIFGGVGAENLESNIIASAVDAYETQAPRFHLSKHEVYTPNIKRIPKTEAIDTPYVIGTLDPYPKAQNGPKTLHNMAVGPNNLSII